jgi:hypothetical protein
MAGLHPFDPEINKPRANPDGSFSTEISRTVQLPDGSWANVPSLWWGEGQTVRDFGTMGDDQLAKFAAQYEQQTGQMFPRYSDISSAETAANARSDAGGGKQGPMVNTPDMSRIKTNVQKMADQWTPEQLAAMNALLAGTFDRLDPNPKMQAPESVADMYAGILPSVPQAPIPATYSGNRTTVPTLAPPIAIANSIPGPNPQPKYQDRLPPSDPRMAFVPDGVPPAVAAMDNAVPPNGLPSVPAPVPAGADERLMARMPLGMVPPMPRTDPRGYGQPASGAPVPQDRINRKGMLDFGGFRFPGLLGALQNADNGIANVSGPHRSNIDNALWQTMAGGRVNPKRNTVSNDYDIKHTGDATSVFGTDMRSSLPKSQRDERHRMGY